MRASLPVRLVHFGLLVLLGCSGFLGLLIFAAVARSAILRVPTEYGAVQTALNAASPGDSILVAPGSYVENIEWPPTTGLKLISEAGAGTTILDGSGRDTVIEIETEVDTTTVIRGFTLRGGHARGT